MANTTPTSSAYSVGVNPLNSEKSKQRMEIHTIHGYPVTVSLPIFPPPMLYHHDHGALPTTRNPNTPVNGIQPGTPSPNLSTPPGPPIFTSPVRPAAVHFRSSPSTPQTIAFSSGSSLPTSSPAQFSNGSVDLQLSLHHLDTTEVSTDSGKAPYVLFSSLKVLKQKKQANIPSLGFGALVSPRKEISAGPQIIGRDPQRCHKCGAFSNLYCSILTGSGQWQCIICRCINLILIVFSPVGQSIPPWFDGWFLIGSMVRTRTELSFSVSVKLREKREA